MSERITVTAGDREFPGALSGTRLTCLACQAGEALAEGTVIEIDSRRWRVASIRDPYALTEAEAKRTIEGRIIGKASNTAVSKMVAEAKKDFGKFLMAELVEETGHARPHHHANHRGADRPGGSAGTSARRP